MTNSFLPKTRIPGSGSLGALNEAFNEACVEMFIGVFPDGSGKDKSHLVILKDGRIGGVLGQVDRENIPDLERDLERDR